MLQPLVRFVLLLMASLVTGVGTAAAAGNPLATEAQIATEVAALRIEATPRMQAVRDELRRVMLTDPGARIADGRASLDRVLDQWIRCHILMQLTMDQEQPALIWIADNNPRTWFGHLFPGDIIAGDNPDNSNRVTYLDGGSSYVLVGRYGTPKSGQFNLNIETAHPAGGMGRHLAVLTDKQIKLEKDGTFRVTIDAKPANGRPNHMQVEPGLMLLSARDSRSDWRQIATTLAFHLVSGPGLKPAASGEAQIERIAASTPAFVNYWRAFKDGFFGFPEPNTLVLPKRRDSEGGWGYIGGGRFKLADDEALIVTTRDGGADYTGFQITDPWTLRPETVLRTSSLNKTQSRPNPDGTYTYVISLQDPGVANWIDTAGLHQGWFQLRWQNVPPDGDPGADPVKFVKIGQVAAAVGPDVPRADLAYRQQQIRDRSASFALRHSEARPDPLPE